MNWQAGQYRLICVVAGLAVSLSSCSRRHYLRQADRQTYATLAEKAQGAPWRPPVLFSVMPDARSRLFDPTNPIDPALPPPAPSLNAYSLPELATLPSHESSGTAPHELLETPAPSQELPGPEPLEPAPLPPGVGASPRLSSPLAVRTVSYDAPDEPDSHVGLEPGGQGLGDLRVVPISPEDWGELPEQCLERMLEFESVRIEFARTFQRQPTAEERDDSPRLTLRAIMELALLNSREYQTQKEILYRAALRLTLERYRFELKFTPSGNGTDVFYNHERFGGLTQNNLSVPTNVAVDKITRSGADLLARFANDVVLVFNGPDGFAADVGSELLVDVSQSLLQRDIRFEALTQTERNVVYAARDFARFRRIFFRDLATQYYGLLLSYRGIAIDAQDYFSNLRAFNQGQAELRANRIPRFQVDQFEQNALRSRSNLIRSCNTLEQSLDGFKLRIGLPPEMPLNLDLTELEDLTRRDEAKVARELVIRARRFLREEIAQRSPDRNVLLTTAIDLLRRLRALNNLQQALDGAVLDEVQLEQALSRLETDNAQLRAVLLEDVLREVRGGDPAPLQLFQRIMDVVVALLEADTQELALARLVGEPVTAAEATLTAFQNRVDNLFQQLEQAVADRRLEQIPVFAREADLLLADVQAFSQPLRSVDPANLTDNDWIRQRLVPALKLYDLALGEGEGGLPQFDLSPDDAMLTALTLRWDLANVRGRLADDWRRIKLAGDSLRGVLDVNAQQSLRTRSDVNRPFDFTWDESSTRLSLVFDTPLNRRAERNAFRDSLLNYQAGRRDLMAAEDEIKLDIRNDLRALDLDRNQYEIAVASAALAFERVVSTRLQLQLGIGNVAARDFLEAQQAYTTSLSAVASEHIGFLVDRIQLFLDLEQLPVDEWGFWDQLYDESFEPSTNYELQYFERTPYGDLPPVWYSPAVRRMFRVPTGETTIH